ncbi:MAG: hypothetical protein CMI73_03645 [Candidatus Pelagibacter sp.]|nr:hypothetical protein [Candidatus Pelagibacter sp.]OUV86933.1 MAG: hypothetical protein CBC96_03575 [Pelagibacteraceae bacterium TMED136]|tara:strand:+ start:17292 stop:17744 length:453 start_codon:yes stop_codon:yes gene_type:complete
MIRFLLLFSIFFFISNSALSDLQSLKNNRVNVRLGPSISYPIKFIYKKKYLPVIIIDQHYNWRKIKDYESDTGWVHISQLSKIKTTVTTKNNDVVFSRPSIYSKPKVKLEIYKVLIIKECNKIWCKVKNSKISGWIKKQHLWGVKEYYSN